MVWECVVPGVGLPAEGGGEDEEGQQGQQHTALHKHAARGQAGRHPSPQKGIPRVMRYADDVVSKVIL